MTYVRIFFAKIHSVLPQQVCSPPICHFTQPNYVNTKDLLLRNKLFILHHMKNSSGAGKSLFPAGKFLLFLWVATGMYVKAQVVDHWESVFHADTLFRYHTSRSGAPDAGWRAYDFDDSGWQEGRGGIGYGDGDDRTIIDACITLFYRMSFEILDTSVIAAAVLHMDYDDAFVAYLNGTEIARSPGLSSPYPAWDETSAVNHEASLYREGTPEQFYLEKEKLRKFLRNGRNVLAVEVHNRSVSSSDMSSLTWFSVGLTITDEQYLPVPSWFTEPWIYKGSTLPLIRINTYGQAIPDEPKIDAWMEIVDNGPGRFNGVDDPPTMYNGHIGIEVRGASSSGYPQKPYSLETRDSLGNNLNVPLFGMPAENDWLLISHYNEKTFMRNPLAFNLFKEMGHYSVRFRLVDVMINGNYEGIYLFTEKIKRDRNRVNIKKLTPDDSTGIDLTGGYIFETNLTHSYDSWLSDYSPIDHPDYETRFLYYYPRYYVITQPQKNYIKACVDGFQEALHQENFQDYYRSYIDILSFIDYFIVSEVSRNVDGYKKSRFYYKNRQDIDNRIHAGPVWDFDWAWKNISSCWLTNHTDGSGWVYLTNDCRVTNTPGWYVRMLMDTTFANEVNCRYHQLRQGILSLDHLYAFMDSIYDVVKEPQVNHYKRWQILGKPTGTPEVEPPAATWEEEVARLKEWIRIRLTWLDENLPGRHDHCLTSMKDVACGDAALRIFPNPAHGSFYVEASRTILYVDIYDLTGRLRLSEEGPAFSLMMDAGSLSEGLYLVQVVYSDGSRGKAKLLVR